MNASDPIDRRQLIGAAALWATLIGVPLYVVSRPGTAEDGEASPGQLALLDRVADTVIPRTGTPGASDAGVGAFVALALAHGLDGSRAPAGSDAPSLPPARDTANAGGGRGLQLVDWLADSLAANGAPVPLAASPAALAAAVARIDAAAFAPQGAASPWHHVKDLILIGYYTSEAGATRELQYELVPGRWVPDLPLPPAPRAWSNDWTALTFG